MASRETQRKGDIALAKAILIFTEMGYDVSLPITESAEYDMIVDSPDGLSKVQVKSCTTKSVDLRKIHSNSKGYVIKTYTDNAYDWLFVYNPSTGKCYLSKEFITTKHKALTCMDEIGSVVVETTSEESEKEEVVVE